MEGSRIGGNMEGSRVGGNMEGSRIGGKTHARYMGLKRSPLPHLPSLPPFLVASGDVREYTVVVLCNTTSVYSRTSA